MLPRALASRGRAAIPAVARAPELALLLRLYVSPEALQTT
jgi:hypothetical protein